MKKLLTSVLLCITYISWGQNIHVVYDYNLYGNRITNQVEVLASDTKVQYIHDFKKKGIGIEYFKLEQVPKYFINNYNIVDKEFEEYHIEGKDVYRSSWPFTLSNCQITNEEDTILGYDVIKASCDGNAKTGKINLWYAPDIPIPAGPLRYVGLPGLVLKVTYEKTNAEIIAKKIDKVSDVNFIDFDKAKVITLSKVELMKR